MHIKGRDLTVRLCMFRVSAVGVSLSMQMISMGGSTWSDCMICAGSLVFTDLMTGFLFLLAA